MAAAQDTVFERVLEEFKRQLTPDEQLEFSGTTLQQLQCTLAAIQQKHAKTRTMQNITRIRRFLEAVQTYSQGPIKYLLIVAHNFSEAFNALLDAYKRIAENLPILEQYQTEFATDMRMRHVLEMIFQDIFDFHREALRYFKGSIWKQVFKSTWNTFESKFRHILDDLRYHKELVTRQASLIEFRDARTHRKLEIERFESQAAQELANRKIHVTGWLSAADVTTDQERGLHAREDHPQSGRWLLARDGFRTWFDPQTGSTPLLWIWGNPGTGKSVLASLIVEEAQNLPDVSVFYFYFRDGDPERNSFVSMARAFLKDLMLRHDQLVDHIFSAAKSKGEVCLKTKNLAGELLHTCIQAVGAKYFVIDGLDECEEVEQKQIVTWLRKHVEDSLSQRESSKCVFLSQYDASTRRLLEKLPSLRITATDNTADIHAFCSTRSRRIRDKFDLKDADISYIVSNTVQRANGMFLFARLVMDNLYQQINLADLYREMSPDVFPSGFKQAYQRILNRVIDSAPEPSRRGARRLLSWLVCALRPLKWREIQTAVSIDLDQGDTNLEQRRWMVDAEELCGALVERSADGTVQLVHSTAKFYLQERRYVNSIDDHLILAQLCLGYFCMEQFDLDLEDENIDYYLRHGHYGFMDYAAVSWTKHAEIALRQTPTKSLLLDFEENLDTFFQITWQDPQESCKVPSYLSDIIQTLEDKKLHLRTLATFASMHMFLSADIPEIAPFCTTHVFKLLYRIRERMEALVSDDSSVQPVLHKHYGEGCFRCPRVYCKRFYDGYSKAEDRKTHQLRHERPFFCPETSCHIAALGYATQKELDNHMAMYHPSEFPTEVDHAPSNAAPRKKRLNDGKFACPWCPKRLLTRGNLIAHKKTHTLGKGFSCNTCQKKFRRNADVKRHEWTHQRFKVGA